MPRISIEVTEEEHKYYKSIAALQGVSIKDMILRTLQKTFKDEYQITVKKPQKPAATEEATKEVSQELVDA